MTGIEWILTTIELPSRNRDRFRLNPGFLGESEQQRLVAEEEIEDTAEKGAIAGQSPQIGRGDTGQSQKATKFFFPPGEKAERIDRNHFGINAARSGRVLRHDSCLSPRIDHRHALIERFGGQ